MWFGFSDKIWLYHQPIDFRKQIDGIAVLVADQLQKDPTSGQLFVFRNRSGNKIKLLWWDNNGFWLIYKRLEKGRFKFPTTSDVAWILSRNELGWLLSGLDITKQKELPTVTAKNFYCNRFSRTIM